MKQERDHRHIGKPLWPFPYDRRWTALLFCILLSLFFWFLTVLDSPIGFTKSYKVPLLKPDFPKKYAITDSTAYPDYIEVELRSQGAALFRYSLRNLFFTPKPFQPRLDSLALDSNGGTWTLESMNLKSQILRSNSLPYDSEELLIDPINNLSVSVHSISLNYEPLIERQGKVVFAGQIDYGKYANLKLIDTVSLVPNEVSLYGTEGALDSLRKAMGGLVILTDTTTIKIGNPGGVTIPMSLLQPQGIRVEPDTIYATLYTEELIHRSFVVKNIRVQGLKEGYSLKLLPEAVRVTILEPRRVEKEKHYNPKLYVDATKVIGASEGYKLEVKVGNPPRKTDVEMIQIEPDRLDFILQEEGPKQNKSILK